MNSKYTFELSRTINTGNYESLRVSVGGQGDDWKELVLDVEEKLRVAVKRSLKEYRE